METFLPCQAAGIDFVMAAEELRREEMSDNEASIELPLKKLFDDIVSFISINDFKYKQKKM